MPRHRRLLALGGAGAVTVAALLGLAGQGNHEAEVVVERPVPTPVRGRLLAGDGTGAIARAPSGAVWAVDRRGREVWRSTSLPGDLRCARCPAAIQQDPLRRVSARGEVEDPAWLPDTAAYGGLHLRPSGDALDVAALGPEGPVALGQVPARSLDPAAYGFAPVVAVALDGRAAAAVVGADDPLAIGRADAVLLRAGRGGETVELELPDPGRAPSPCRPDGTDRWGWVDGIAGDQPWLGSATFTPADGARTGPPVRLRHPYAACVVTTGGVVLTAANSGPRGTYPAVAWLDDGGRIRHEEQREAADPSATVSVASTGRVVVPAGEGFDVLEPTGSAHHLDVDDALVAADGTVWVLRGDQFRRWRP